MREKRIEGHCPLLRRSQHDACDWYKDLGKLRLLDILQHRSLGAFFFDDALIVRKIEGGRLHSAVAFTRPEDFIHGSKWRGGAELRVAIGRVDGEIVFQLLQMLTKLRQLVTFSRVAQRNISLKPGLVTKEFVFVRFVWTNGHFNRCIEV